MTTAMLRPILRAAAVGAIGGVAAAIALALFFTTHPDFTLEMDRDLPRILAGVYRPERADGVTFAWTSGRAELTLDGLDRHVPWTCTVRFRGGRSDPPQPDVQVAVDGIRLASRVATNEYQEIQVTARPRDRAGLVLTIAASPTIVPGPRDPRQLGVQLDRLACGPGSTAALPPRAALASAMLAAALMGAGFGLINITAGGAAGAAVLLSLAQAVPLSRDLGPYVNLGGLAMTLALWIALAMVAWVRGLEWWTGKRLRNTARFVIAFSAAAFYLKLLVLMHPSKPLVDAVFQAHRLDWVLAGRLLFTQPMPGGVHFPYAIGLYVFAAPWSLLTNDHVMLLRVIVCAAEVLAGTLLYVMIVRTWGDRLAGAVATALFSLVPMTYVFVGAANLTNVFGQCIALLTMAALTTLTLRPGQTRHVMVLVALAAWAFLCHVSTFATLLVTLSATVILYWWLGGPALRTPARRAILATGMAMTLSLVAYYGHFGAVYKNALRVRAQTASAAPQAVGADGASGVQTRYRTFTPLHVRVRDAVALTAASIGWPILLLTAIGGWRAWTQRMRDRLAFAILAWIVTYLVFLIVGVMRVDVQYQRYSYEFVGRVAFATYPAAVILAGYGAVWAWQARAATRVASAILLLLAVAVGVDSWLQWMR